MTTTTHAEGCCCFMTPEQQAEELCGYPGCDRDCPECECCEVVRVNSDQPQPCLLLADHGGEHEFARDPGG